MTLQCCLELGKECGLMPLDECVRNVEIHSSSLFTYADLEKELNELYADIEKHEPEWFHAHYKKGVIRNERDRVDNQDTGRNSTCIDK